MSEVTVSSAEIALWWLARERVSRKAVNAACPTMGQFFVLEFRDCLKLNYLGEISQEILDSEVIPGIESLGFRYRGREDWHVAALAFDPVFTLGEIRETLKKVARANQSEE